MTEQTEPGGDQLQPQLEVGVSANPSSEEDMGEDGDTMKFQRYLILAVGALAGVILLILLIGVGLAVLSTDSAATAARLSMIRDVFIIIVALEFILIIVALALLIMQVTRLIVMLQNEIKPILEDSRETVDTAKGTAQFVGKNVTRPVITASSFMAGAWAFAREIGGIRRAIKRTTPREGSSDASE
ncbi:MAG: hypothetical protein ACOCX3_01150 [Chloroflexota bacterium]